MKNSRQAYVLVGPTAVGKSAVAEAAATSMRLPILSADSMLVYRGLTIGTAKPDEGALRHFPYHGVNVVDPDQSFSVADYLAHARASIGQGDLIVSGGTGLYIKCLIEGLSAVAPADAEWRREAESILSAGGVPALQAEVKRRAPERYASLRDPKNPRRLIRAVEQAAAGASGAAPSRAATPPLVGLRMEQAALNERIRRRVETMYDRGLLDEVRALQQRFPQWSETARQAIGYAEALTALAGGCTVQQAKEITILRTRQLAKRQMTWFRNQAPVDWIDASPDATAESIAGLVQSFWEKNGPTSLSF